MLQQSKVNFLEGETTSSICDTGTNEVVGFYCEHAPQNVDYANVYGSFDGVNFFFITDFVGNSVGFNFNQQGYTFFPPYISYIMPRFIRLEANGSEDFDWSLNVVMREV